MALSKCVHCKRDLARSAKRCPHCGAKRGILQCIHDLRWAAGTPIPDTAIAPGAGPQEPPGCLATLLRAILGLVILLVVLSIWAATCAGPKDGEATAQRERVIVPAPVRSFLADQLAAHVRADPSGMARELEGKLIEVGGTVDAAEPGLVFFETAVRPAVAYMFEDDGPNPLPKPRDKIIIVGRVSGLVDGVLTVRECEVR